MLFVAAILIFALAAAHSVLGERYILVRLFRRGDLPKLFGGTEFTARTLRFAWHITSVTWIGFGTLLWQLGRGAATPTTTAHVIGATSLACAALPLAFTRGRHLSWVVFLAIGALALCWPGG